MDSWCQCGGWTNGSCRMCLAAEYVTACHVCTWGQKSIVKCRHWHWRNKDCWNSWKFWVKLQVELKANVLVLALYSYTSPALFVDFSACDWLESGSGTWNLMKSHTVHVQLVAAPTSKKQNLHNSPVNSVYLIKHHICLFHTVQYYSINKACKSNEFSTNTKER